MLGTWYLALIRPIVFLVQIPIKTLMPYWRLIMIKALYLFKTLSFGSGVNFTAGLSKVRTSPDHGTAYEIAGKGKADPSSFKEALFKAIEIFRNRQEYLQLTENQLQQQKVRR